MPYEFVKYEKKDRIAHITINRPQVFNSLHPPANAELWDIWTDFRDDPEYWVAIITGAGDKAFCAGNDLKYHAELQARTGKRPVHPAKGFGGLANRFDLDKPVIAAVNGVAMGGGFEIALACDLVIAAENAVFALPEPRVGLVAGAGGVHRLPRMIGQKQALGMILTGRRVSAAEGKTLGFVNEVVPQGEALAGAKRWAATILECSPLAVRASKQCVYAGMDEPTLEKAITTMYPSQQRNRDSQDYIEGPKAFAEKRKPNWQNR